jgi:diacylglycerol O-acyltransferase / trehalose O-mycolyltransferase
VPAPRVLYRLLTFALLAATFLGAACTPSGHPSSGGSRAPSASAPSATAHVTQVVRVSARIRDLTIATPSVDTPVPVRLLLPTDFDAQPTRRWPVLYLLHGCCDTYRSWTLDSDIEAFTSHRDVIVAMPDGGAVGFYSDWRTGPQWETFHVIELHRILEHDFRASDIRAIAGLSMGGLGALDYAARHRDQFRAVAAFSAIADTRLSEQEAAGWLRLVAAESPTAVDPRDLWGDPVTDAASWAAHNPYDLAERLRGLPVFLSCGSGVPGPLDPPGTPPNQIEAALIRENTALADRLRALGVAAHVDLYGPGTHSWPYWQRELHRAWPMLASALGVS